MTHSVICHSRGSCPTRVLSYAFRYRGYVYDAATGLYYLQSRYYDPQCGRFLNPDDTSYLGASGTVLGWNLYTYCENDAVNYNDHRGTTRYAVFYDNRHSGYFWGYVRGKGFREQAKYWYQPFQRSYRNTVNKYPFTSIEGFISQWNKASKNKQYDYVFILAHGYVGSMDCEGQRLLCDGEYESNEDIKVFRMNSLRRLNAVRVYLFICNAATKTRSGNSLADLFFRKTYALVFGVSNGKVNINYNNGKVEKSGGVWTMLTYSVTISNNRWGVSVKYNYYRIDYPGLKGYEPKDFLIWR